MSAANDNDESLQDAVAVARDACAYLNEYEAAVAAHGAGTHRDPAAVLRDLHDAVDDTYGAVREAYDNAVHGA